MTWSSVSPCFLPKYRTSAGSLAATRLRSLCVFDIFGSLDAQLSGKVSVGVWPFKKTWSTNFATIHLLDFSHTMTTLPAKLLDEHGAELGHCTVVFDWADLPSFLGSFRPLHSRPAPTPASA